MFCTSCGNQMERNAAFCDKCGKQVKPVSEGDVQDRPSGRSTHASAPDALSFFVLLAICVASVILFFMNWFNVRGFEFRVYNINGMLHHMRAFIWRATMSSMPFELRIVEMSVWLLFLIPIFNAIACYKFAVSGSYGSAGRAKAYGFSRLTGLISAVLIVLVLLGMLILINAIGSSYAVIGPRVPLVAVLGLSVLNIFISGRMRAFTSKEGLERPGQKLLGIGGMMLIGSGILASLLYSINLYLVLQNRLGGFVFVSPLAILLFYIFSLLFVVFGLACVKHQRSLEKAGKLKILSIISLAPATVQALRGLFDVGFHGGLPFFFAFLSILGAILCLLGAARNKEAYTAGQTSAGEDDSPANSNT